MPRHSLFASAPPGSSLLRLGPENLDDSGLSPVGLVRRILELEGRIYPVEAHGHVGSALQWAPVFEAAPDSCTFKGGLIRLSQIAMSRNTTW